MNAPASAELFVLPPGTKKLTVNKDTRAPNTCIFTVQREDHTLGNLVCGAVQKQSQVIFAGYSIPHPLEPIFNLRVQTTKDTTPRDAVLNAVQDTIAELDMIQGSFIEEVKRIRGEN